jgi:hypothetical protein
MDSRHHPRAQVDLSDFKLLKAKPTDVRRVTWKYASRPYPPRYSCHTPVAPGRAPASRIRVSLAVAGGILLFPFLAGPPFLAAIALGRHFPFPQF